MYYLLKKKTSEKPITVTEDIIEELSKRTGKDVKLLKNIIDTNNEYLKRSIRDNPEIVIVNIPNLGKLHYNYYLGLCYQKAIKNAELRDINRSRFQYMQSLLKIEGGNKLKNFNKPIVFNQILCLFKTVKNTIKNFYKYWTIIEKQHNDNHKKYFGSN